MQGVRKGLPVFGFIGNYKSRLLYDDFRLQPLTFAAGKDMLMDDSKNSGVMKGKNGMIYDSFTWEEGETLASDIKEKIIQTLYKRFGGFLINKRTIDDIRCDKRAKKVER